MTRRASCAPCGALVAGPRCSCACSAAGARARTTVGRIDHVETDGRHSHGAVLGAGPRRAASPRTPARHGRRMDGKPVDATAKPVVGLRRSGQAYLRAGDRRQQQHGRRRSSTPPSRPRTAYIDAAPDDVYIGLVTFASDVEDRRRRPPRTTLLVTEAIDSLELTQETAPLRRRHAGPRRSPATTGSAASCCCPTARTRTDDRPRRPSSSRPRTPASASTSSSLDQEVAHGSPLDQIATASGGTVTSTSDPEALSAAVHGRGERPGQPARRDVPGPVLEHDRGHPDACPCGRGVDLRRQRLRDAWRIPQGAVLDGADATQAVEAGGWRSSKPMLLVAIGLLFAGTGPAARASAPRE